MKNEELKNYIEAGKIAKEVMEFCKGFVKPGLKLIDIALAVDDKIKELGGDFAFPVNLSLDEIAAHFTPEAGDETIAEGILKVDFGVCVNGFIADCAFSVDLTEDKKFEEMIELNKKILAKVKEKIRYGMEVREVGDAVFNVLEEHNRKNKKSFTVIRSLSGHELGENKIHAGLTISNYRNDNTTDLDEKAFAIEPFVTTGVGDVYEGKGGGIYVLQSDGNVREKDSREILKYIKENYKTRPFCLRWLERAGFKKIKFSIGNLVKQGILYQYPLLIEKSKVPVSQFEHTFILHDGKVFCTTD